jgi:two-component system, sensor histidine kinase and response regulator
MGFDAYVTKPILDETLLLEAIEARLANGRTPETAPMRETGPPGFDALAVERLCQLGGEEFARKMIDLFLDNAGTKLEEGCQALAAGDLTALAKAMHALKSSAGNIGANRVQDLADQTESLACQSQRQPLAAVLDELNQAFAAAKSALDERKQMLGATGNHNNKPAPAGGAERET